MAETRLKRIRAQRLLALKKLRSLKINPYPAKFDRTHTAEQIPDLEGKKVAVAGRIVSFRRHGGSSFADLRDFTGKVQIYFQRDILGKNYDILDLVDVGDFIGVSGEVFRTQKGEITIRVHAFQILAKSLRPLPSGWYGLKDIEERYRQRYVDLILNPEVRERFLVRTKFVKLLRQYLDDAGFIEVETPILQPIYGGASAKPFITHHEALDTNLYLRISDELYLKRLIVGGFEKVYEVGKDFRNEGIDRQHNPEFTQVEFYWAYADYKELMEFVQGMLTAIIEKLKGKLIFEYQGYKLDFTPPWRRVTFRQLLVEHTGIDIDKVNTERKLLSVLDKKGIRIARQGIAGFGALIDRLYKEYARPKLIQPTFVTDYPTEMIALAKRREDDPDKIASFQVLVAGFEIVKAYNELNDPIDQKRRWEKMEKLAEKGLVEHEALDEDYLRALEYGMPPTAGCGIGIDRTVEILTDAPNIKEVILFPILRPEKK